MGKFKEPCIFSHLVGQESLPAKLYEEAVRSGKIRRRVRIKPAKSVLTFKHIIE